MKQLLQIVWLVLCPFVVYAQVELHPIYSSPHMGSGAKFSEDGSKIVTWGGFGFSVWDAKTGKVLYTVTGHKNIVNYAEFNHKGTAIVTASDDNTAKIWGSQNGELQHTLIGHKYWVCNAKFNATDDRIITNSEDGNALLWNADTGTLLTNLNGKSEGYVQSVHFNKKGDKAVALTRSDVKIYDAKMGTELFEYSTKKGWFDDAIFDITSEKVYVQKDDSLLILKIDRDFAKVPPFKKTDTVVKRKSKFYGCCGCGPSHKYCKQLILDIHANNNHIVRLRDVGIVEVSDIKSNKGVFKLQDTVSGYKSAYFNESGTLLFCINGKGVVTVWNTSNWKKVLQVGEENSYIESVNSDYEGNKIAFVGENKITRIYNGTTGELERVLKQNTDIKDDDFDDIHYCIAERTKKGTVAAISRITGEQMAEFDMKSNLPKWIHYYPKVARYVLCFDTTIEIRNPITGNIITTISNLPERYYPTGFSESGDALVIGIGSGYELRNTYTGKRFYERKLGDDFYQFVTRLNTDKRLVFTDGKYNTLSTINVRNDRALNVLEGHTDWISSGIFSKNENYVVTGSYDSTARVWNVKNGKSITILKGHKGTVSAHFDSEANRVITASEDGTAKVWNTFTGELIANLIGHKGGVFDARFSNDDQKIITQSHDGTLKLYDANQLPYSFTDIPEEEKQTDISLSPNPAQNEIHICFSEPVKEKGEYIILSPTGVLITKGMIENGSNGFTYGISNTLSAGTYICVLRINGKNSEEKFVVMR